VHKFFIYLFFFSIWVSKSNIGRSNKITLDSVHEYIELLEKLKEETQTKLQSESILMLQSELVAMLDNKFRSLEDDIYLLGEFIICTINTCCGEYYLCGAYILHEYLSMCTI
jgi:hypothetical protein